LHPVQEQVFFEQYWNQKALYIPGRPDKFSGLFDRAVYNCVDLKDLPHRSAGFLASSTVPQEIGFNRMMRNFRFLRFIRQKRKTRRTSCDS
ncbi:MAG TPA: hypothetical protein VF783_25980, partial [Terriglobales bacterium]